MAASGKAIIEGDQMRCSFFATDNDFRRKAVMNGVHGFDIESGIGSQSK